MLVSRFVTVDKPITKKFALLRFKDGQCIVNVLYDYMSFNKRIAREHSARHDGGVSEQNEERERAIITLATYQG